MSPEIFNDIRKYKFDLSKKKTVISMSLPYMLKD